MATFRVVCEARLTALDGALLPSDVLEGHLDEIMERLLELEGEEHDIDARLVDGHVEISVLVRAGEPEQAAMIGGSILRAAVHAAGGYTPAWSLEQLRLIVESGEVAEPRSELAGV